MVRVLVLRGVIASGQRLVAGTTAEISERDAKILIASDKVAIAPAEPPTPAVIETPETDTSPVRETATRSRRRKATL